MQHAGFGYEAKTYFVYVNSYHDGNAEGEYCSPLRGEAGTFRNLTELLLKINQGLEKVSSVKYAKVISYEDARASYAEDLTTPYLRRGQAATFVIQIHFCRNASWQGSLGWLDGKRTCHFKSVLELLTMLSGILESAANPSREAEKEII